MHHHNPSLRFDPRFDAAIQTARQDQDACRALLHERWLGLARLHLISLKADLDALRQDLIARRKPAYPAPLMGAAPPSRKYSPDQPRLPGGQSGGGQWTSGGGDGLVGSVLKTLETWDWQQNDGTATIVVSEADLPKLCLSILDWLGPGAIQQNSPKDAIQFFSADRTRCIRFDITPATSHRKPPHINIEPGERHIWMKGLALKDYVNWNSMEPTFNRQMSRIITTMNNMAVFLREQGHVQEAISVLEALSWGDETYETGDYAYQLGLCHESLGNLAEARAFFEIALRENPATPGRLEAVKRLSASESGLVQPSTHR